MAVSDGPARNPVRRLTAPSGVLYVPDEWSGTNAARHGVRERDDSNGRERPLVREYELRRRARREEWNGRDDVAWVVVDDPDARVCGRWQRPREDDDVEHGHGTVPTLRGHHLVRLASHDGRVELTEQRAEVDGRIHHDPVMLAVRPGDEAVQAHRHLVSQSSRHWSALLCTSPYGRPVESRRIVTFRMRSSFGY